jgi:membrane protein DedA with SNARE-associated domain
MPLQFTHFVLAHGYLAIFLLVFLQELGVPTIVPNELALIFFGYLAHAGTLLLTYVLTTALSAEMLGTGLLYTLFYLFGSTLFKRRPRWLPLPWKRIAKWQGRLADRGHWGFFVGRLTPFVRGYSSVIAGLLRLPPGKFGRIIFASAICSTGGYVMVGWILAPYWSAGFVRHASWNIYWFIPAIFLGSLLLIRHIRQIQRDRSADQSLPGA